MVNLLIFNKKQFLMFANFFESTEWSAWSKVKFLGVLSPRGAESLIIG
ncbi:hypothetical protein A4U88_3254 [Serratia marcescens]|nr:hypothetical protein A4U88_3254 [Serratia marcescens]